MTLFAENAIVLGGGCPARGHKKDKGPAPVNAAPAAGRSKFILLRRGYCMPTVDVNGVTIELDEDGFMVDPDLWNEDIAKYFAASEGITGDLTEEHWKVIRYIRDYYKQFQIAPMVRKLCKETGCNLKRIYELFPSGPAKGACKLAGLPKPTGCV